ncbi:hypothetical protein [Cryobacterium fucosi]|uniref:Uncharacterized protein n=1 Tax=Cryobacterium fucosi TaxID=1259157 RepID=A0A4R9BE63_9MICO|nr:hypothetical protein [Cryobacterium fucosi]TFD82201.1 hypothetical protein E3T48_02575 [Cryobacterium fucosi]
MSIDRRLDSRDDGISRGDRIRAADSAGRTRVSVAVPLVLAALLILLLRRFILRRRRIHRGLPVSGPWQLPPRLRPPWLRRGRG